MNPRYDLARTDQPVITVAAARGDDQRGVTDHGRAAPRAFYEIVSAIARERDGIRWTGP